MREATLQVLSDAYWQVASFVAATLWLFYLAQTRLQGSGRLVTLLGESRRAQVVFGASMGVLPGCGGAIIVATQFVKGRLSFGSLVAVLTATMGDAVFLLLATRPEVAALIIPSSLVAGALSGMLVDRVHDEGFLRPDVSPKLGPIESDEGTKETGGLALDGRLWIALLAPTALIGALVACQVDVDGELGLAPGSVTMVGAIVALVVLCTWSLRPDERKMRGLAACHYCADSEVQQPVMQRVADDTGFVLSWVVMGFLAFEFMVAVLGVDLSSFSQYGIGWVILAAIMVGWIPGCGPQILTTTMYLNGAIPLSAQLGNAVSNDGDALFPALALAPRAAIVATIYSTVPALIVGYGYWFLFE